MDKIQVCIELILEPFPHAIIRNFYNTEELRLIWRELDFLTSKDKLTTPPSTAIDEQKALLSNSKGIFLDNIYAQRNVSDILRVNRKIFDPEVLKSFASLHPLMGHILNINADSTLIRYYEHDQNYEPHIDNARFTICSYFFKEPKAFDGGDLEFIDFNYIIPIENNMVVFFMGCLKHASKNLSMKNSNNEEFSGLGKYGMLQFLDRK